MEGVAMRVGMMLVLCSASAVAAPVMSAEMYAVLPSEALASQPTVGGLECTLCQAAIKKAEEKIESPEDVQKIEDIVDKLCAKIPGNLTDICDALVAKYVPPLLDAIVNKIDPEQVCTLIDMCGNSSTVASPRLAPVAGIECSLCEDLVEKAEDKITSPQVEGELEKWVEGACDEAPASVKSVCQTLVEDYLGKLVTALVSKVKASAVCLDLHFCRPSEADVSMFDTSAQINLPVGGLECMACKKAVTVAEKKIESDDDVAKIEAVAEKLCDKLPASAKDECDAVVDKFLPPLIKKLVDKADPEDVCEVAGACKKPSALSMFSSGSCDVCEVAVGALESKLEAPDTVSALQAAVDSLCAKLPAPLSEACDAVVAKYLSKLVDALVNKAPPASVCSAFHLCPAPGRVPATPVAAASVDVDADRKAMIAKINSSPGVKWHAAPHPRFAGQPVGVALRALCGVHEVSKELVQSKGAAPDLEANPINADAIPESFDSEKNWPECAKVIGDIRDQSNCGCCWAFGAAEAASDRLCIASGGKAVPLSAQELCFCASEDGCDGGDLFTPWSFIQSEGLVSGGQYNGTGPFGGGWCSSFSLPHCHHHGPQGADPYPAEGEPGCPSETSPQCPSACDASAQAPHDSFDTDKYTFQGEVTRYGSELEIQHAIMTDGPVEAAFTVYEDFENYAGGIYHHVTGGIAGGHAIRIVGWGVEDGTKYWKIANSWNPYWGEEGYFRIVRGTNECGIEDQVTASPLGAKWSGGAGYDNGL